MQLFYFLNFYFIYFLLLIYNFNYLDLKNALIF